MAAVAVTAGTEPETAAGTEPEPELAFVFVFMFEALLADCTPARDFSRAGTFMIQPKRSAPEREYRKLKGCRTEQRGYDAFH